MEYAISEMCAQWVTALILPKDKDEGWSSKENPWSLVCSMEMPADKMTSPHLPQKATREFYYCIAIMHNRFVTLENG